MRFSLQYYLGTIAPADLAANPQFGFTLSATLSTQGGPIFIAGCEDFSPLIMESETLDPLEILAIDISPLVMEE